LWILSALLREIFVTFQDAVDEFAVRYYLWALEESRIESNNDFCLLSRVDSLPAAKFIELMRERNGLERDQFARALIKRFHPRAIALLNDHITLEEKEAAEEFRAALKPVPGDRFWKAFFGPEREPMAKASDLKRSIKAALKPVLGAGNILSGSSWSYRLNASGFIIETSFMIGTKWHLSYDHRIFTAQGKDIEDSISICSWLGLSSQTQWHYISANDVRKVAGLLVELSDRFVKIAPKLLKDIEV
jgi:hypothetical protein